MTRENSTTDTEASHILSRNKISNDNVNQMIINNDHDNDSVTVNNNLSSLVKNRKPIDLSVLLANARSLAPKIRSLIDYFSELDLHIAMITESWMKDGTKFEEDCSDLELGKSLGIIHKNRKSRRGRTAGGGVLIAYNKDKIGMKDLTIRRGQAELVCATGKLQGLSRKIVILTMYLPPKLPVARAKEAIDFASDVVGKVKSDLNDPFIRFQQIRPDQPHLRLSGYAYIRLCAHKKWRMP